jgi:hypothetical protein
MSENDIILGTEYSRHQEEKGKVPERYKKQNTS